MGLVGGVSELLLQLAYEAILLALDDVPVRLASPPATVSDSMIAY
jgi:hypothetical protein